MEPKISANMSVRRRAWLRREAGLSVILRRAKNTRKETKLEMTCHVVIDCLARTHGWIYSRLCHAEIQTNQPTNQPTNNGHSTQTDQNIVDPTHSPCTDKPCRALAKANNTGSFGGFSRSLFCVESGASLPKEKILGPVKKIKEETGLGAALLQNERTMSYVTDHRRPVSTKHSTSMTLHGAPHDDP
ncbi:unnamed protein product [Pylaiella littoralis]